MRQKSSAPLIVLKNVQKEQKIKVERVNVNIHKKLRFLFLTFSGLEVNLPRLLWDRANFFRRNFFLISRVITMKFWKARICKSLCMGKFMSFLSPFFNKSIETMIKRSLFHCFNHYDLHFNLAKFYAFIIFDFGQIVPSERCVNMSFSKVDTKVLTNFFLAKFSAYESFSS